MASVTLYAARLPTGLGPCLLPETATKPESLRGGMSDGQIGYLGKTTAASLRTLDLAARIA